MFLSQKKECDNHDGKIFETWGFLSCKNTTGPVMIGTVAL